MAIKFCIAFKTLNQFLYHHGYDHECRVDFITTIMRRLISTNLDRGVCSATPRECSTCRLVVMARIFRGSFYVRDF